MEKSIASLITSTKFNMKYYLNRIRRGDLEGYSSSTFVKHLKKRCFSHLKKIARILGEDLGLDLEPCWISKSTLGAVLCDYKTNKTGMSIVPSQKALFELIHEDYDYVVFSKNLERNLKIHQIGEGVKALIINIDRYETFIETFKDKFTRVKLFLYKKLTISQEEIINGWIESRLKSVEKQTISAEEILDKFSKEEISKIVSAINRLESIKVKKTLAKIDEYSSKLNEFEKMVNNEKTLEKDLQEFLHNNLWIIDFKYDKLQYDVETEFQTGIGNIDLILFPKNLNKKSEVIIELKRSSKTLTSEYRKGKPAIKTEVGQAISQTIHYIESMTKPYQVIEGIILIGREDPTNFIKIFNKYLHGLEIKTYYDLIESCRKVISLFKVEDIKDENLESEA